MVGGIDNLLYPMLVGNRMHLRTLVFISIVGGLFVFGAAGLILGPMLLTVTTLWRRRGVIRRYRSRERSLRSAAPQRSRGLPAREAFMAPQPALIHLDGGVHDPHQE